VQHVREQHELVSTLDRTANEVANQGPRPDRVPDPPSGRQAALPLGRTNGGLLNSDKCAQTRHFRAGNVPRASAAQSRPVAVECHLSRFNKPLLVVLSRSIRTASLGRFQRTQRWMETAIEFCRYMRARGISRTSLVSHSLSTEA
jgi:hypothetical protein